LKTEENPTQTTLIDITTTLMSSFRSITWTTTTSTFKPSVGYRYPGESPTIRWHVCR